MRKIFFESDKILYKDYHVNKNYYNSDDEREKIIKGNNLESITVKKILFIKKKILYFFLFVFY
jgi:hypothetical protein